MGWDDTRRAGRPFLVLPAKVWARGKQLLESLFCGRHLLG